MRKYILSMILAVFAVIAVLPLTVQAEGTKADLIELKQESDGVLVKLTLAEAAGEEISSLGLGLKLESAVSREITGSFVFGEDVTKRAKVAEYRYQKDTGILNLYIAGTEPLFGDGEETITLGKASAKDNSGAAASVKISVPEDSLTIVEGTMKRTVDHPEVLETPSEEEKNDPEVPGGGSNTGDNGNGGNSGNSGSGQTIDNKLKKTLDRAKEHPKGDYTSKSYKALQRAIKKAQGVLDDPNATEAQKQEALQELENAMGALEPASMESSSRNEDNESNSQTGERAKTGDVNQPLVYALAVLLSMLVMALVLYLRKNYHI